MVTPTNLVRKSIIARHRYTPENPNKALRGSLPGSGVVVPTIKAAGDHVITSIGEQDEQPTRTPRTQERG